MEIIRDILAAHPSGISRDGLLAWARLRGDPGMTDAQLEAALGQLGDAVVDDQGFLFLREHAPSAAREARAAVQTQADPSTAAVAPAAAGPTAASAMPAWVPPGDASVPPPAAGAWSADGQPGMSAESQPWVAPDGQVWATPPTSNRRTMIGAAIGVVIFLVVAGIGASVLRQGTPVESASPSTPAPATPPGGSVVGAGDLAVGDCMVLPSEDQFKEIRRLPCTDPHGGEVFYIADDTATTYPTDAEYQSWVEAQCMPVFATYTGSTYDSQNVLDVGWFTPTNGAWDRGDRAVTCYLMPADGSMTSQSYRDANP